MKRVLITGANSYVGTNVEKWLMREPDKYYVETVDMKNPNWNSYNFSNFDVVFHVAGIAHVSTKKSMKDLYYRVNRDLTIEVAKLSKQSGVKLFIFMSSMIVYNSKLKKIEINTLPNPDNFYGKSKLEAENEILKFDDYNFGVCVVRPSFIYGENSKGNFTKIIGFAKKIRLIPDFRNKKSMLYIDNLCIAIKSYIDEFSTGIKLIANPDYVCTSTMIQTTLNYMQIKYIITKLFNPLLSIMLFIPTVKKAFGDRYYSLDSLDKIIDSFVKTEESFRVMYKNEN